MYESRCSSRAGCSGSDSCALVKRSWFRCHSCCLSAVPAGAKRHWPDLPCHSLPGAGIGRQCHDHEELCGSCPSSAAPCLTPLGTGMLRGQASAAVALTVGTGKLAGVDLPPRAPTIPLQQLMQQGLHLRDLQQYGVALGQRARLQHSLCHRAVDQHTLELCMSLHLPTICCARSGMAVGLLTLRTLTLDNTSNLSLLTQACTSEETLPCCSRHAS